MKVACLQYDPKLGEKASNMKKASKMIERLHRGDIDLLVLPEMAFSGYVFRDRQHIDPMLETEEGSTYQWCRAQALRLDCWVVAGYPLKTATGKYLNALCCVSQDGTLVKTYAKHFLYESDKCWAEGGPGFSTLDTEQFGKLGMGICMDLNPWEYKDPSLYEFATHQLNAGAQVIIFLANWLDSDPSTDDPKQTQMYWVNRLRPLVGTDVYFIAANRTGQEEGSIFMGGSCVISLKEPALLGSLNKREEGVLVVNI